jgi:hypothetical protein
LIQDLIGPDRSQSANRIARDNRTKSRAMDPQDVELLVVRYEIAVLP